MAWRTGKQGGDKVGRTPIYGGGGLWDDPLLDDIGRFGGFGDFGGIGIFGCVDDRPFLKGGGNQWAWKIKTGG